MTVNVEIRPTEFALTLADRDCYTFGSKYEVMAMSEPIVRRTAIVLGGIWAGVFLFVVIQSVFGFSVGIMKPEGARLTLAMTAPFTVGLSVVVLGVAFLIAKFRGRGLSKANIG